jgi:hypothetical protein
MEKYTPRPNAVLGEVGTNFLNNNNVAQYKTSVKREYCKSYTLLDGFHQGQVLPTYRIGTLYVGLTAIHNTTQI